MEEELPEASLFPFVFLTNLIACQNTTDDKKRLDDDMCLILQPPPRRPAAKGLPKDPSWHPTQPFCKTYILQSVQVLQGGRNSEKVPVQPHHHHTRNHPCATQNRKLVLFLGPKQFLYVSSQRKTHYDLVKAAFKAELSSFIMTTLNSNLSASVASW